MSVGSVNKDVRTAMIISMSLQLREGRGFREETRHAASNKPCLVFARQSTYFLMFIAVGPCCPIHLMTRECLLYAGRADAASRLSRGHGRFIILISTEVNNSHGKETCSLKSPLYGSLHKCLPRRR